SIRQVNDRVLMHCHAGCTAANICAAIGATLADLYDDMRRSRPNPMVDRRRLATQGLENWRQMELQRCADQLRARDTLCGAITRLVKGGQMTEEAAWDSLEDAYRGYSDLEYKFELLLHGDGVLALWREERRTA